MIASERSAVRRFFVRWSGVISPRSLIWGAPLALIWTAAAAPAAAQPARTQLSWTLAGNTAGFGEVSRDHKFWVGNFDGQGGGDILFYYPTDQNWWLGRFNANGKLSWTLAGNTNTETLNQLALAGMHWFWVGNFDGQGGDDILYLYPGDDKQNWLLGRFDAKGTLSWNVAGSTADFGQVGDERSLLDGNFWVGNFDGQGRDDILLYSPGNQNWWLGHVDANGRLSWNLAGNTTGFGQVADKRPIWVGKFDGQGRDDILFYYPGDQNWWLGRFDANGRLSWKLAGNTSGFGQVADGRPFWVGNFDGQGGDDILFYYPGDQNWWLGRFDANGTLSWKLVGNTKSLGPYLGRVNDGRPFWVGNFDGKRGKELLFYAPVDKTWWLGSFDVNGTLSWSFESNTTGFGQVYDGRPFWVGNFDGQGRDDILFYYPGDKNWWLGRFGSFFERVMSPHLSR